MEEILIFGSSGHAKVIMDIIEFAGRYKILGLVDDHQSVGDKLAGARVLGPTSELQNYKTQRGIIAIGDNFLRAKVAHEILAIIPNFEFINAIHPSAQISPSVRLGQGVAIMAGVCVNPDSWIGNHCLLNTNSNLDHDCNMRDFSSIAPGVSIGGGVTVGYCSAIGIGACIQHNISIGDHAVVGSGSVVINDVAPLSIVYGVGAKKIRTRVEGEKYL